MSEFDGISEAFSDLLEDPNTPRNLRSKAAMILEGLTRCGDDISARINQALCDIESLSDDVNLQPLVRMQLLSIASMLEAADPSLRAQR